MPPRRASPAIGSVILLVALSGAVRPRYTDGAGLHEGACVGEGSRRYYVYVLTCADGSLYSGITTDVVRRVREHLGRGARSARYTRAHPVTGVAALWEAMDRSSASRLEWRLHHMTRAQKERLLACPHEAGHELVSLNESMCTEVWDAARK